MINALRTLITSAGCGVFVLIVTSLHVLRRDISPFEHGISRYVDGDTLALTTCALLAFGAALVSLAVDVHRTNSNAARWLVAAAGGLILIVLTPIGNRPPALTGALFLFALGGVGLPLLRPVTGLRQRLVFALAIAWTLRTALR
jgi:uncharacterized protein DUF998